MNQKIYSLESYTIDDFESNMNMLRSVTGDEVSQDQLISQEDDDMISMYTNHEEGC